jgi:hypothetical protein
MKAETFLPLLFIISQVLEGAKPSLDELSFSVKTEAFKYTSYSICCRINVTKYKYSPLEIFYTICAYMAKENYR